VAVEPVLARVLDLVAGQAEQRRIDVRREFEPVAPIAGDEERLRQVVMNLALNALQAVPDGGWLRVSCRPAEDPEAVEILVEDSGPGVPAEIRDRIFEPFFTTKPEGSGLGLPIVQAIVSQHGGTIGVDRAPEGGARFAMRLPRSR
jgi:signal transduction histidine kinase